MALDAIKISKESGWKRSWKRRHPLTVVIFSRGVGAMGGEWEATSSGHYDIRCNNSKRASRVD